jgi:hypothetical protein
VSPRGRAFDQGSPGDDCSTTMIGMTSWAAVEPFFLRRAAR